MTRKKVVMLTPRYAPSLGGVERHVEAISKLLVSAGHQVMVITVQTDLLQPEQELLNGVQVVRMAQSQQKTVRWRQVWLQRHWLNAADIIQVHDVMWWLWPWWWHRSWLKKVHLTFHGWEGIFPVPWRHKFSRWISHFLAQTTLHIGAWIQEFYWEQPDAVSYGGVEVVMAKRTALKTTAPTYPHLVFLGRLEPENGLSLYFEVIKKIKNTWPELRVTWVGDGSYRRQCSILGRVTGWIADSSSVVVTADLVLASSYLSILEALALGKVVVAGYQHHLKHRYLETFPGKNHMIVADDVSTLEKEISKILSNKSLLSQRGAKAQRWAETQSWSQVLKTYQKLWGWQP